MLHSFQSISFVLLISVLSIFFLIVLQVKVFSYFIFELFNFCCSDCYCFFSLTNPAFLLKCYHLMDLISLL